MNNCEHHIDLRHYLLATPEIQNNKFVMSIYHHQPYQPVSNGRPTKLGDIENLRLLSVSDSDVEAEPELKQRGGSPKISKNVPDLKLTMPSGSIGANRVLSTAGKIRKKIRLKR